MTDKHLSVLLVEPSKANRLYLQRLLEAESFSVLEASNALDALALCQAENVDLIITEVEMPFLSGAEYIQSLRSLNVSDRFVPIFVVTASLDSTLVRDVLESGADDFLQKPYLESLFLAKLRSLIRNISLNGDLIASKELIAKMHRELQMEQIAAEKIFDKFVYGYNSSHRVKGVEAQISPISIFNGDVFLSAVSPNGNVITLLGDFTGHGLPAAIGAIPVAEIFYSMVKKGFGFSFILQVINDRLESILPAHIFFGCIGVEVCVKRKLAQLFNAGMQPILFIDALSSEVTEFKSTLLPLGVLPSTEQNFDLKMLSLSGYEQIVFFSDGVVEAVNQQGVYFGIERIKQELLNSEVNLRALHEAANRYSHDQIEDDVSLIRLDVAEIIRNGQELDKLALEGFAHSKIGNWTQVFCFDAVSLKHNERLIEGIVDAIMMLLPLPRHKEELFLIVSEEFNNLVEHGVLGLSSELKQQPNGFELFLQAKHEALMNLTEVAVEVKVENRVFSDTCGELILRFAYDQSQALLQSQKRELNHVVVADTLVLDEQRYSGRGLFILSKVCRELKQSEDGHLVQVIFDWGMSCH